MNITHWKKGRFIKKIQQFKYTYTKQKSLKYIGSNTNPYNTVWMNLKIIMLNERSQRQKTTCVALFYFYEISRYGKSLETEISLVEIGADWAHRHKRKLGAERNILK